MAGESASERIVGAQQPENSSTKIIVGEQGIPGWITQLVAEVTSLQQYIVGLAQR